MRIFILSRRKIEELIETYPKSLETANIVSIVGSGDVPVDGFPPSANVLRLQFDDLNAEDWDTVELQEEIRQRNQIIFNETHARDIIEYLENMDRQKNLIVHCLAGVCRSGAIGYFTRMKFGLDYDDFMKTNPQIVPNTHILGTLMRVQETN